MLNTVVSRGGILATEINKPLLRQFVWGCWDNELLKKLQLAQCKEKPPTFSELLLLLRTEEDRQQAKEMLMTKHRSASSSNLEINIQSQSVCSCGQSSASNKLKELKQQMQQLQRQMSAFLSTQKCPAESKSTPRHSSRPTFQSTAKPKVWYCFKCSEDGHISSCCNNVAYSQFGGREKKELSPKTACMHQEHSAKLAVLR